MLSKEDKRRYLNSVNNFYDYDKNTIDIMVNNYEISSDNLIDSNIKIMSVDEKAELLKLFKLTISILDKLNIEYWIDGGTLLGAMQIEGMIFWDDDIDIAIPEKSFLKLVDIISDERYKKIFKKANIDFDLKRTKDVRSKEYDYQVINSKFIKSKYDYLFIDLVFFIKIGEQYNHNFKLLNYPYDIKDIYPLREVKFENFYVKCINNPYPFLNNGYWFWRHLLAARYSHLEHLKNNIKSRDIYYINKHPYVYNYIDIGGFDKNILKYINSEVDKLPNGIRENIIINREMRDEIRSTFMDNVINEDIKNIEKLFKSECMIQKTFYDKLETRVVDGIYYKVLKKGMNIFRIDNGFITNILDDKSDVFWFASDIVSYSFARLSYTGLTAYKIIDDILLLDFYNISNINYMLVNINDKRIINFIKSIVSHDKTLSEYIEDVYRKYSNKSYVMFSTDKKLKLYSKSDKFIGNRNPCNPIIDNSFLYCTSYHTPTHSNTIFTDIMYKNQYIYYEGEIKKNMFSTVGVYGCTEYEEIVLPRDIVKKKIIRDYEHYLDWERWKFKDFRIPKDGLILSVDIVNLSNQDMKNINKDFNLVKFYLNNEPNFIKMDGEYTLSYNINKKLSEKVSSIDYIINIIKFVYRYRKNINVLFLQNINIENDKYKNIFSRILNKIFKNIEFIYITKERNYTQYHIYASKTDINNFNKIVYKYYNHSNIKQEINNVSIVVGDICYISLPETSPYYNSQELRKNIISNILKKDSKITTFIGTFNFTLNNFEDKFLNSNNYNRISQNKIKTSPIGIVDGVYSKIKIRMDERIVRLNYSLHLPMFVNYLS